MIGVLSASSFALIFSNHAAPGGDRQADRAFPRRALWRTEPGAGELQRLKDFTFHKVFPTGAGRLFGHRPGNRVADVRVGELLARGKCQFS